MGWCRGPDEGTGSEADMWREGAIAGASGANLRGDRAEKIFLGF